MLASSNLCFVAMYADRIFFNSSDSCCFARISDCKACCASRSSIFVCLFTRRDPQPARSDGLVNKGTPIKLTVVILTSISETEIHWLSDCFRLLKNRQKIWNATSSESCRCTEVEAHDCYLLTAKSYKIVLFFLCCMWTTSLQWITTFRTQIKFHTKITPHFISPKEHKKKNLKSKTNTQINIFAQTSKHLNEKIRTIWKGWNVACGRWLLHFQRFNVSIQTSCQILNYISVRNWWKK